MRVIKTTLLIGIGVVLWLRGLDWLTRLGNATGFGRKPWNERLVLFVDAVFVVMRCPTRHVFEKPNAATCVREVHGCRPVQLLSRRSSQPPGPMGYPQDQLH